MEENTTICPACGGKGHEEAGFHNGYWIEESCCPRCGGTGRIEEEVSQASEKAGNRIIYLFIAIGVTLTAALIGLLLWCILPPLH